MKELRFDAHDSDRAYEEWEFNCGPGALCAILGMTPAELRPHMIDFESKGYCNPTLMRNILIGLHVEHEWLCFAGRPPPVVDTMWPGCGLVRVQWDGPWCADGKHWADRYYHTHWIACSFTGCRAIFDINAMEDGGWISFAEWTEVLVPDLLRKCEPKAYGNWWVTHAVPVMSKPKTYKENGR